MRIVLLVLVLLLAACSPMDVIKGAFSSGDGPSLEVDTTVGDKQEAAVGQVGNSQEIKAESIEGGINTTTIQEVPIEFMLLMILGWLLPSPNEIYRATKRDLTSAIDYLRGIK